ncbi:MAG: mycothiol system anti-sigma-R factor [Angustibacter sp.]
MGAEMPHAGHGDCSEVLHRIHEYLDGELGPDDVRRFATHLAECAPCLAEHDLDVAMKQAVRRSCVGPAVPATLRFRVVQQITVVRTERES